MSSGWQVNCQGLLYSRGKHSSLIAVVSGDGLIRSKSIRYFFDWHVKYTIVTVLKYY